MTAWERRKTGGVVAPGTTIQLGRILQTKRKLLNLPTSFWASLPSCLVLGKHGRTCQKFILVDSYRVPSVPDLLGAMDLVSS